MTNRAPKVTDAQEAAIQRGIAADPDNPELTDAELAAMRPAKDVLSPELLATLSKRRPGQRGPGKAPRREAVQLRLKPDVLAAYRATGDGWQTRMGEILERHRPKG
jgi:uncharacterized protein (DUF4415 family)